MKNKKIFSINPILVSLSKALTPKETQDLSKSIKEAVAETGESATVRQLYKAAIVSTQTGWDRITDTEKFANRVGQLASALLLEDEEFEKHEAEKTKK